MPELIEPSLDPGTGLSFVDATVVGRNVSGTSVAITKGELCQFAFISITGIATAGYTATSEPGADGYFLSNIASGAAQTLRNGLFCVALEDIAYKAKGRFLVKGVVKADVGNSATTSSPAGSTLVGLTTASVPHLDAKGYSAVTTARKILGLTLEDSSTSVSWTSDGNGVWILFDGINGFGGADGS